MQRVMPVLQKGNACNSASVAVSNVSLCGVVYHFYMDRTFGIHTCLYDVLVLYIRDTTYGISQYPSGFADLWFGTRGMMPVYVNLSNTNSSVLRVRAYNADHLFLAFGLSLSQRNQ